MTEPLCCLISVLYSIYISVFKNPVLRDTAEALMLANRMAAYGYFFPIDDHVLAVKNDNTYYRFQVGA